MFDYLLAIDFGSIIDHTALILIARSENPLATEEGEPKHLYEIVHTEQLPLNLSYVDIIKYIESFVVQESIVGLVQIVVDCTGVGKAVLDLMRSSRALEDITWSIVFTAGQSVTQNGMIFKVPKKDLIAAVLILTGKDLIKCDPQLADAEILRREMLSYIMRKSTAGNLKYDGEKLTHDDMVVALCMACWIGERIPIDLTLSSLHGAGRSGMPMKAVGGSPLINAEAGGVNLGFQRPPRDL